jgi:hypothetical protein
MLFVSAAGAQDIGGKPIPRKVPGPATWLPKPQPDQYAACFFSPEDVMAHQADIKLQDDQRTKIAAEIGSAQAKITSLQWQLSAEQEKLHKAAQPATVDETAILKQVDRILAIEQEVKRTQMALMIRVKNTLTVDQQSKLRLTAWVPIDFAKDSANRASWTRRDSVKLYLLKLDSVTRRITFLRGC